MILHFHSPSVIKARCIVIAVYHHVPYATPVTHLHAEIRAVIKDRKGRSVWNPQCN